MAALLEELGAPQTLATVIEGESLLNDGTAFVFFSLFKERAKEYKDAGPCQHAGASQVAAGDIARILCRMSIGGAAFGAVMGFTTATMLKLNYHRNNQFFEIMITLCMPFITFWVAENPLELSGVLATVIMALVTNKDGRFFVRHHHGMHEFWSHLSFVSNTIVTDQRTVCLSAPRCL